MEYQTRIYREGDEMGLVKLFNHTHEKYAGFVPRTRDYWLWCCRNRPDVEDEGIIIVEEKKGGTIVGYGVIGKSGNIWELCANPNTDKKRVLSTIFESANEYLRKVNSDKIALNVSSDDLMMQEICAQQDFSELPPDQMFIGIVNFEALLEALARNSKEKLGNFKETITFELLNARSWVNPIFSVKVDREIHVFPNALPSNINVKVDSNIFASILLGETRPLIEFLKMRLRVHPLRKSFKALKFLNAIKMRNLWFYPLADLG